MATRTVLILFIVLTLVAGSAQSSGIFSYGAKAGLSFAATDYKYEVTALGEKKRDWRNGLLVGVVFDYRLLPFASVRPEFTYVQKGSKYNFEITTEQYPLGTGEYMEANERIDYLSLQLLVKVRAPKPGPHPYLLAGPRLDLKLSESSDFGGNSVLDKAKSTVFGGTVGAGFSIPVGPVTNLFVEFEYYPDFGDAVNETAVNVTNKSLSVAAGLMF